jgi:hypothetical protein
MRTINSKTKLLLKILNNCYFTFIFSAPFSTTYTAFSQFFNVTVYIDHKIKVLYSLTLVTHISYKRILYFSARGTLLITNRPS